MKLISRKLILGVLVILIISSIAAFFLIDNYIQRYMYNSVRSDLAEQSYSIQRDVYNISQEYGSEFYSNNTINFLIHDLNNRYDINGWIKINGQLFGLSEDNDLTSSEIFDEAIDGAFNKKKSFFRTSYNDQNYDSMIMHFPVYTTLYEGADPVGVIGISYPLVNEAEMTSDIRFVIFLILLIFNLFIISFIIIYFKNLLSPLTELQRAMFRFQRGNYDEKLFIETEDELEELAKSFNNMKDRIDNLINRLELEKKKQKSFYDNMTHELKTPLTIIKGYVDMYHKVDDQKTKQKCIKHIQDESNRMLRLVNNLLQRSKIEKYDYRIEKELVLVNQVIEETMAIIEIKAIRNNIDLNFNYNEEMYLNIDVDKIKEVLLNILDNAIKYSQTERIDISIKKEDKVKIIIKDYGVGIESDRLEKLFNSKWGDYYSTERGIGLKISKEIINLHDGEFDIKSEQNNGTTVIISFKEAGVDAKKT